MCIRDSYLTAEKIIKYGLEMDIMVEVFTNGRAYTLKRYMDELVEYGVNPRFTEWLKDTRETVESFSDILNNDSTIENINLIFSDMDKRDEMRKYLLACPDVELTNSIVNNLCLLYTSTGGIEYEKNQYRSYCHNRYNGCNLRSGNSCNITYCIRQCPVQNF